MPVSPKMEKPPRDICGDACSYLVRNKYNFISLERLVLALRNEEALPPKPVVFTLDDGYVDQAEIAVPIFLEFDCPVTFFVITGMLDHTLWPWDAKVSWIIETTGKTSLDTTISGQPTEPESWRLVSKAPGETSAS